jgi:hypothetical protein
MLKWLHCEIGVIVKWRKSEMFNISPTPSFPRRRHSADAAISAMRPFQRCGHFNRAVVQAGCQPTISQKRSISGRLSLMWPR